MRIMPHRAIGDVDVQRSVLADGEAGVDQTVEKMTEMAQGIYGAKSAKIRALAINIINGAGVGDKDYYGYAKAIHEWVRDEIRYIKDPVGQETLSYPEETAFNSKAGDCDDKTILEMALLGSVGIRSYPVVVGMRKGSFSHVYLNIIIPDGGRPGRHAGEHIPADPIMREWALGQEAPPGKIQQKKTYEHLSGLGFMPLNGYQSGPAYIDERNVPSVKRALAPGTLVDTASRGEILNAPKVDEHNTDELDDMFTTMPELAWQGAPWGELGPYGPVTGAEAAGTYRKVPHRKYERALTDVRLSFKPSTKPVQKPATGLAPNTVMIDRPRWMEAEQDLDGLGTYIDSIMGEGICGDPVKVAAVVHLARNRVKRARGAVRAARRMNGGGFLPGLGALAVKAEKVAKKANNLAKLSIASHGPHAQLVARHMENKGLIAKIDRHKEANHYKIQSIQIALYTVMQPPEQKVLRDEPAPVNLDRGLGRKLRAPGMGVSLSHGFMRALPPGAIIQDRKGNLIDRSDGMGSWFTDLRDSASRAVKRISAPVAKPIKKMYDELPGGLKRTLAVGVGLPLGVAMSPLTLVGASKPVYSVNRAALGDKWGGRLTNVERIGAAATAAALAYGAAVNATAVSSPGAAANALAADGSATITSIAPGTLPGTTVLTTSTGTSVTVATSDVAATVGASGLEVAPEAAASLDALAVSGSSAGLTAPTALSTAGAGLSTAGSSIASGASWLGAQIAANPWTSAAIIGGAGLLALAASGKPKKKPAVGGAPTEYYDALGNKITKAQYDALMAQYNAQQQQPQVGPSPYDPYADYMAQQAAASYGGGSMYDQSGMYPDPWSQDMYGSPDAAPPVDTFGPDDMSAATEMESGAMNMLMPSDTGAIPSGYAGAGGRSFTSEVYASGDEMPGEEGEAAESEDFAPEEEEDSGYSDDDETESVEPAPRRRRGSDRLDTSRVREDRDVAGLGADVAPAVGLGTAVAVGLAIYLLMKKRK